jgi:hypothetical protein
MDKKNACSILGVTESSPLSEIREAYKYRIQQLNKAYDVLTKSQNNALLRYKTYAQTMHYENGKMTGKSYKEINDNGKKVIEKKIFDGNNEYVQRIDENGNVKQFKRLK